LHFRGLLILIALALFGGTLALADWGDLIPRQFGNGAYLDLFASYEHDELTNDFRTSQWTDVFFREKLTFFSNGYFYHPRFLQYHFSVSGALKQENFNASYLSSEGWHHGTGYEYDARMFLLPEHPYNLELYALRFEPLLQQQASTQSSSVQSSWGGLFRYRDKPWFFSTSYNDTTTESGVVSSNVTQFSAQGEYFRRFAEGNQFSLNAGYNPTHFSNNTGIDGDALEYTFGGLVDLQTARLTATVTQNNITQESFGSRRFENDQTAWYEVLNLYFPKNFRSDISYRIQDNENTIPVGFSGQSQTLSDLNKIFELDIIHRLYESLDSTFTHVDNSRTSPAGDTDFTSNSLAFNYNKLIPRGRFLAGLNLGRSRTDTVGQVDVVDESHPAVPVPGFFTLDQPNVDPGSVVVFLRSPLPPFNVIRLVLGVDYTLTPIANRLEVQIVTLPPQFALPGTYDFTVSYSLTTGTFDLQTDDVGYNVSVDLLDGMFTPYYGYVAIRSKVLSGVFPGVPLDSTTRTLGLRYYRGPLRALAEYQNLQWNVSPYRAYRLEAQYVGNVNPTTRCYANGSYVHKYFPQGTSLTLQEAYTDDTLSAAGSVQKQIPSSGVFFSVGGVLSRLRGRVTGTAYALNSTLTWRVGKLDMSAGAIAEHSVTESTPEFTTGTDFTNERLHRYIYFNLRRTFF
jgi:hypothetical protein